MTRLFYLAGVARIVVLQVNSLTTLKSISNSQNPKINQK